MPSTDSAKSPHRFVKVEHLVNETAAGLELRVVAGEAGLSCPVTSQRIQKPGLALAGHRERIHTERVQVLGSTELAYLGELSDEQRLAGIDNLVGMQPSCIVVTGGVEPPTSLAKSCEQQGVALLATDFVSSEFIDKLTKHLGRKLAQTTSVHGVLMDVLGVGVLLMGKSGIGKSEAALELVMRGHRLVADDVVDIRRQHPGTIYGSGSDIIKHHMEIRGLGVINIKDLFGISAIRDHKKVELVIELVEWDNAENYDRHGLDAKSFEVLEVKVPYLRIPVRPGRNMTSIIEVAARNELLKHRGHDSAREFADRINQAIAKVVPSHLAHDEVE